MANKHRHPCPTVDELKSLAARPVIDKDELVSLVQGFCPDRSQPKGCISYLANYAFEVGEINAAEVRGEITFPIKTTLCVKWCSENGIALPEMFVGIVIKKLIRVKRPKSAGPYSDELVRYSEHDHNRDISRSGRKRVKEPTVRGYEPSIIIKARLFVRHHIQKYGVLPRKKEVNNHLAESTGRTESEMNRAFRLKALLTSSEVKSDREKYRRELQSPV